MPRPRPIAERFWENVKKGSDCWQWQGAMMGRGWRERKSYGIIAEGAPSEKNIPAHRLSWILHYGPIPHGMMILHKCDNRSCVRPDHLFVGTAKDNTQDMLRKGRDGIRGSKCSWAKLLEYQIILIRRFAKEGASYSFIAEKLGIHETHVRSIIKRKFWRHVA